MPILILTCLTALFVGWLLGEPIRRELRRRRVRSQAFPASWRQILRQRVPYFRSMPADLQLQLKKRMQVFLAEKNFIGCAGLEITDEMRITIAAQACMLILNRRTDYFPNLRQILVYPGAFVVRTPRTDEAGLQQEHRRVLTGESWSYGQVILSWQDTLQGANKVDDGCNVVIHEFAHQLDQESGPANGAPRLIGRSRYARWAKVMEAEFRLLQERTRLGQPSLLNEYGATEPTEFFAVASEVFFERPLRMAAEHPALYAELSGYYRLNPLSW